MNRKWLALLLSLPLMFTSCEKTTQVSQSAYIETTHLYYQELNGYKAAIINLEWLTTEPAKEWIRSIQASEGTIGYFQYVNTDFENWEMLLYWPGGAMNSDVLPDTKTMRFSLESECINMHFDKGQTHGEEVLLLIQGPKARQWPMQSNIYVEQQKIELLDSDYAI